MHRTLTAHMMVRNEEKWLWYSMMSIIDYVDQILIYDTGSTDHTVDIIDSIKSNEKYAKKVQFIEKGSVSREEFVKLRKEQIDKTTTDYFIVVDGDEIYYSDVLKKLREALDSDEDYECGIIPFICCAGDVFHYRDPKKELYTFDGKTGAIALRVLSMHVPGISCGDENGQNDGYYDVNRTYIVPDNGFKTYWSDGMYLHMSYMLRSSSVKKDAEIRWPGNRINKLKNQSTWDGRFPKDFKFPEAFYLEHPDFVDSPWKRQGFGIRMLLQMIKNVILLVRRG